MRDYPEQMKLLPPSRFMGSKRKILKDIYLSTKNLQFNSALDLFSGSSSVSYLFKSMSKKVISNDHLFFCSNLSKAFIENNNTCLSDNEINKLFYIPKNYNKFISETFKGLYFDDKENDILDIVRHNIKKIKNEYKKAIALASLIKACQKKRPRGIFTYIGNRYDDGRLDLKKSFEEHIYQSAQVFNKSIFDNGNKNLSKHGDSLNIKNQADLIYIDPPYLGKYSDNEYVRRYHFLEGLARDWKGVEIQENTQTKKFKKYETPFSNKIQCYKAFEKIFNKYKNKIILVSYSSNSIPSFDELKKLLLKYKRRVSVKKIDYNYSFANQYNNTENKNSVKEYLFIGKNA